MATLNIQLLGKLHVQQDEAAIHGFEVRKVQELFCYLLLNRRQAYPRESLANLFWNDCSTAQSKKYLRKALWQLQTAVSSAAPSLLLAGPEWIQVNPQADIRLDVGILESAFNEVRSVPGAG